MSNAKRTLQDPRVSIGLPVYNGERYLAQALDSFLAQTFTDFEIIISDNASTDGTETIARDYLARDGRIRYLRNATNFGAALNYNRTVLEARGEYFKWAAHDDLCAPAFLERCVEVLDGDSSVILCYSRTMIIDEHGNETGEYVEANDLGASLPHARLRSHLFESPGECNAVFGLFRRNILVQTPMIGAYHASDMILLGEVAMRGRLHRVPEFLFLRRDHAETSLNANSSERDHAMWFDTMARGRFYMPHWRWLTEYLRSLTRVSMGGAEKARCFSLMGKWAVRDRHKLQRDLVTAAKTIVGRDAAQ